LISASCIWFKLGTLDSSPLSVHDLPWRNSLSVALPTSVCF
jgi:hypothetical protein